MPATAPVGGLADEFDAYLISTGSAFRDLFLANCAPSSSPRKARSGTAPALPSFAKRRGGSGQVRRCRQMATAPVFAPVKGRREPKTPISDSFLEELARDGELFENALHLGQSDQTLTLLWFDDDQLSAPAPARKQWDEDTYRLPKLDGVLP